MTETLPEDATPWAILSALGFDAGVLSSIQQQQLELYVNLLLEANQSFNLTAVRSPEEVWRKHILESLQLAQLLPACERLIDVGSGGGLPGMVIAITMPGVAVTLLEATAKKANFLRLTAEALGLRNVRVECQRAETAGALGAPLRENFDVVTARAVAPLQVLVELTAPFLKVGGSLIAVKGEKATQELLAAKRALTLLGLELSHIEHQPNATVLFLNKQMRTANKYPRAPGEPKRRPL